MEFNFDDYRDCMEIDWAKNGDFVGIDGISWCFTVMYLGLESDSIGFYGDLSGDLMGIDGFFYGDLMGCDGD
jgi:hypothetical protein